MADFQVKQPFGFLGAYGERWFCAPDPHCFQRMNTKTSLKDKNQEANLC